MTEIDSLTVGVGLTQEDFQAGVQKILHSLGTLRTETTATGESMTSSLSDVSSTVLGLGLKFAGLFVAVKGMDDVIGYFKNLSHELTNLSYSSEYLGQSVENLSRFGQVAKLAGGQAQDAISSVRSLQQSIFGLEFQGQMSQNLLMLQRLGVAYLTAGGQMRDMKDIAFDMAKALQEQLPGKANEPMRVQYASMIFAGGMAEAVGKGLAPLREWYAKAAQDQKNITQKAADAQRQLQQHLTNLSYVIKNDAVGALNNLTPKLDDVATLLPKLIADLDVIVGDLNVWFHPGQALANAAGKPLDSSSPTSIVAHAISWFREFETEHLHIDNSKLADLSVPLGVRMRLPDDANLQVLKMEHLVAGGDKGDPTWSKAILAYLAHAGIPGAPTPTLPPGVNMSAVAFNPGLVPMPAFNLHALSTPSARRPEAAASGATGKPTAALGGPRVTIGGINIQTQATDANSIAANIDRALKRKLLVSTSDPGLA